MLGAGKAAGDEHELRGILALGIIQVLGLAMTPVQVDHAQGACGALLIKFDLERIDRPLSHFAAHQSNGFLLAVIGLLNVGPLGPCVVGHRLIGCGGQELKLSYALGTLAHCRAHAIVACVAAANDDDVEALGADSGLSPIENGLGRRRKVIDRIDHAGRIDIAGAEATRRASTRCNNYSIALLKKLLCHRRICRIGIAGKLDTQLFHKVATTFHDIFLELHVGDTVHEQTAGAVIALNHTHASTTARKLPCRRQTGRTGANHRYEWGILVRRLKATRTARRPLVVGDGTLVIVNGRGLTVHRTQVTGGLAKRWAHAARKLRQRACERQALRGLFPAPAIHQLIPLRDKVMQRAARWARLAKRGAHLAKRHAAHHAAARLDATRIVIQLNIQLIKIAHALVHRTQRMGRAIMLKKRSWLTHD